MAKDPYMQINHAILHVLDFDSSVNVFSSASSPSTPAPFARL